MRFELPKPTKDGLITPQVKSHSRDKHYYPRRYLDAFSTSMRPNWTHCCYVDLFAGAGIENVLGHGLDWGSPLVAAQVPTKFTQLLLNNHDKDKSEALQQRLKGFAQPNLPLVLQEDANTAIDTVIQSIPTSNSLTLAFLDPFGLHLSFETVQKLAKRKTDLVIFFPDRIDALRNWKPYYFDQEQSNLDSFLGTDVWRAEMTESNPELHPETLRQLYENQLKKLGFKFFDYIRIRSASNHPLYRLIFASAHPLGLKIWRGIAQNESDGQTSLF